MPVIQSDDTYIELVSFETEDAAMQRLLVNALAKQVKTHSRLYIGQLSRQQ